MTPCDRNRLLESYGSAPALLCGALRTCPKKMWLYKSAADRWSIHDHLIHLADCEAIEYVACRRLVAEPDKPSLTFGASKWVAGLGYFHQSAHEAFRMIGSLRRSTHRLLATLHEASWHCVFEYPHYGRIELTEWLEIQERHIPHHIKQIKETHQQWLKCDPPGKSPSSRNVRTLSGIWC